ncbi:arsenical-resistance protein [Spinellus fusiger]|nr:arsenical-resistance protein [Spinellus fusiger]
MLAGVLIGYYVPNVQYAFSTVQFGSVSLPIAIGLLVMMYPVLLKVHYETLPTLLQKKELWVQIAISTIINWVVGPIIMTALAWATLPDLPGFRTGVVMVGIARCIAMVLLWNQLAGGDPDYCAILVAVNSILQIALYSPYSVLFVNIIPAWFGAPVDNTNADVKTIAVSVLIYLGIPLTAGFLTRIVLTRIQGDTWFNKEFVPRISPLSLIGLLYTITVMFANQGHQIIDHIGSVFRVMVPLVMYFIIMFFLTFFILRAFGLSYSTIVTQSFTASSNNFELAIALTASIYGIDSEQVLASTIGPLVEVPVLLGLTYVCSLLKKKLAWKNESTGITYA